MKTAILIPVCFIYIFSFGQENTHKLVVEVSPLNASLHAGLYLNVQGKLNYTCNKHLSISARHNQEIFGGSENVAVNNPSEYSYRRNSLTDLILAITLFNAEKPHNDPTEAPSQKWRHKLIKLDFGLSYFKYANRRPDYYIYELDDQGNYKIINSINRLSASLGFSFILRENNISDPNNIKLKRQQTFSVGAYYGINYDLQGYIKLPEKNPSLRAPKTYSFNRGGYYFKYNFRQQLTEQLFLGTDMVFSKTPYVNYEKNSENPFLLRGGESEPSVQLYVGITIGWAF